MPRNTTTVGQQKAEDDLPEIVTNFFEPCRAFSESFQELENVWKDEAANTFHKEYFDPFINVTKNYLFELLNYHDVIVQVTEASKELLNPFAGTNGISFFNVRMVLNRLPRRLMDRFSGGWKG